jgi:hypothetical protein
MAIRPARKAQGDLCQIPLPSRKRTNRQRHQLSTKHHFKKTARKPASTPRQPGLLNNLVLGREVMIKYLSPLISNGHHSRPQPILPGDRAQPAHNNHPRSAPQRGNAQISKKTLGATTEPNPEVKNSRTSRDRIIPGNSIVRTIVGHLGKIVGDHNPALLPIPRVTHLLEGIVTGTRRHRRPGLRHGNVDLYRRHETLPTGVFMGMVTAIMPSISNVLGGEQKRARTRRL